MSAQQISALDQDRPMTNSITAWQKMTWLATIQKALWAKPQPSHINAIFYFRTIFQPLSCKIYGPCAPNHKIQKSDPVMTHHGVPLQGNIRTLLFSIGVCKKNVGTFPWARSRRTPRYGLVNQYSLRSLYHLVCAFIALRSIVAGDAGHPVIDHKLSNVISHRNPWRPYHHSRNAQNHNRNQQNALCFCVCGRPLMSLLRDFS